MPAPTNNTRLISHTYSSVWCPKSVNYSKVHGPNPGSGSMVFPMFPSHHPDYPGLAVINRWLRPLLGQAISIVVDRSIFHGYVIKNTVSTDDATGAEMLTVSLVDWRDRLHDFYMFGAFNILEKTGVCWHMLPKHWGKQQKIVISKELDQFDFDDLQEENTQSGRIELVSKKKLLSSATILNIIAEKFNFNWYAVDAIKTKLKKTRPMNLDWQDGVNGAQALEDLLSKSNMIWTVKGRNEIVIHKKGVSRNLFFDSFLNDPAYSQCAVNGSAATKGEEISQQGRRVQLVGERNKYQYAFPCRPDWNYKKWDFETCFNGIKLSGILRENGLTLLSKVKELPESFHDDTDWKNDRSPFAMGHVPSQNTRNEMTIGDYVDKICFRSYKVDFTTWAWNILYNDHHLNAGTAIFETLNPKTLKPYEITDMEHGVAMKSWCAPDEYPWYTDDMMHTAYQTALQAAGEPGDWEPESRFPVSPILVTESNTRFIAVKTTRKIILGKDYPFEDQRYFSPTISGATLETYENIQKNGRVKHGARLVFDSPQFIIEDLEDWDDPDKIKPDKMLAILSLDREVFTYERGSTRGIRVRTQKKNVPNLHRTYVDGKEKTVLAENYQRDLKRGGAVPATRPVMAKDIAKKIARQMLSHLAFPKSGTMTFIDMASHEPDGTINNVNVTFDDVGGVTENIAFTGIHEQEGVAVMPPNVYRVSRELPTTAKENRERVEELAKSILANEGKAVEGVTSTNDFYTAEGGKLNAKMLQRVMISGGQEEGAIVGKVEAGEGKDVEEAERGDVLISE